MKVTQKKNIAIIGNGGAAVHAVMAARSAGFTGQIDLISDSEGPAFNPMLAPYFLKGALTWDHCFPFGSNFYRTCDVTCRFNTTVDTLNIAEKSLQLSDKKKIHYDQCLIATGASAVVPPVPGLRDSKKVFTLRTTESTLQLQKAMQSARNVIVLGASLVGTKLAEILSKRKIKVTLLDIATQILPMGAHPKTAEKIESYFRQKGIEVLSGCGLDGIEEVGNRLVCHLPHRIFDNVDFVAVCTGVKPNLQFLEEGQVATRQALLVDNYQRTSANSLYAAGDVCQGLNRQTGESQWMGTWGNACYQGRTAGYNMTGKTTSLPGALPQYVSPFFDWVYAQVGDINRQGCDIRTDESGSPDADGGWQLLVFKQEKLIGVNLINAMRNIGVLKKEIDPLLS
ncbi:NAD(P)/FAD-dependent oxidoreductase [bacterium]|nr:NAD(P)/FAD-dependent oxidoreductase [bacterium]